MFVRIADREPWEAMQKALRCLRLAFPNLTFGFIDSRAYYKIIVEVPDALTELELETVVAIMQRVLLEQEQLTPNE